jgi:O-acetyl-ADP-ribose deacetylase (regulator of RNase III)
MNADLLIVSVAVISGVAGLVIYFWNVRRKENPLFNTTNVVAWLLIALVPVLIIFSFFPQSSTTGTLFGFSVTGAVAAFIFIWWFGTLKSQEATARDQKISQFDQMQTRVKELEDQNYQLQIAKGGAPPSPVVSRPETFAYKLQSQPNKKVGVITGDIQNVKIADVWVNSENTNMQMARFHDRSISGTIRWMGSQKDFAGDVDDDLIANELKLIMGNKLSVQPATVIPTGSGELQKTNKVKKIFHVASVQGQVAAGYRPIEHIESCVTAVLKKADSDEYKELGLKTILFPLLGVGHAQGDLKDTAHKLLDAAIAYLNENGISAIDTVYFLAWTQAERDTCKAILDNAEKLVAV